MSVAAASPETTFAGMRQFVFKLNFQTQTPAFFTACLAALLMNEGKRSLSFLASVKFLKVFPHRGTVLIFQSFTVWRHGESSNY